MKKKLSLHRETLRQLSLSSIQGVQGGAGVSLTAVPLWPEDTKTTVRADNTGAVDPNG